VIEIDVTLHLARFPLRIETTLSGQAVAVLGPSGAGKTSLLECIAGLRRKASGRIVVSGMTVLDTGAGTLLPPERRRIGYVPQDALLFPHLTVEDNVRFGMRAGAAGESLYRESVAILEIEDLTQRYPATLSGGERQRVALARAIATEPRLLLLDEPLAAVDQLLKGRILPYLLRIRDELRIPFLYVTHNAGEARTVAKEALVLREGGVAFSGPSDEALRSVSALDPEARFDNVLAGELGVRSSAGETASLSVGSAVFAVPGEEAGTPGRAVFAVAPEDVLVSTKPLTGVSARNVRPGAVISREISGSTAWIRIGSVGLEWTARLTLAAAEDLALQPGSPVWIAVKSHAFRRLR
jgi:molybdate transport system ATP-binding protein